MAEILLYCLVALALAGGVVVALAALKPASFSVSRTRHVAAPPERVYPLIADLAAMNTWNPFVAPDPNIRITYEGPASGTGARHTWAGNRHVGEGSIEIVEAVEPSRVAMKLRMVKPMRANNDVTFTLSPSAGGTDVTWVMSGPQPLLPRIMTLFIDCDRMVGGLFETGLAGLEARAVA